MLPVIKIFIYTYILYDKSIIYGETNCIFREVFIGTKVAIFVMNEL